ncbi:hypothetical protein EV645_5722 [Kribbella rubisoli]|uniref:Uncharacterized protein n=1 Tax=Kribbella rubisoli TaxID=3075929 RepID=A0A4Q7WQB9_9ACTN|nr:hypothetical protein [Kribbella rubisoli]RZU12452.1 hypothetical protein EV645_5722 [Kribbella rubisoli]
MISEGDWQAACLARFRQYDDRSLQLAILTLTDWRNHTEGTPVADSDQVLLLLACQVRDERVAQGREIANVGIPVAELLGGDDDEEGFVGPTS